MISLFRTKQLVSALAMAGVLTAGTVYSAASFAAEEDDGPRQPPATRSSDVLTERVFKAISEIQELMSPEDENDEPDYARAKEELDALNERYDRLNDFEKSTLLNFYTNYYLSTDQIDMALQTFERILEIEELRVESRLRALMALGQLYMGEERYTNAIESLIRGKSFLTKKIKTCFRGLAYSQLQPCSKQPNHSIFCQNQWELAQANGKTLGQKIPRAG